MEALGINFGLWLIEFVIVGATIGLPIISLIDLARKKLTGLPLAIWALVICAVPVLGSVAYWIIKPTTEGNA
jgi:phospholipase D-like protein